MIAAVIAKQCFSDFLVFGMFFAFFLSCYLLLPHLNQLNQLPPPLNLWQVQFFGFHQFRNTPNSGKQTKVRFHSNHLFQPNLRS